MRAWVLAAKRSLSQAALLSSIAIVVAVITGFLVGGANYLDLASARVLRSDLVTVAPRDAALRFESAAADDTSRQADRADVVLRRALGGIPARITRTAESPSLPATLDGAPISDGSSSTVLVELAADTALQRDAQLVLGRWPAASIPTSTAPGSAVDASIQADAARSLGLRLGDELVVGEAPDVVTVRLVATWRVSDSGSPRWFADLSTTGRATDAANSGTTFGPIVIPEGAFPEGSAAPTVRWTVTPRIDEITTADLPRLSTLSAKALDRLNGDPAVSGGAVEVSGELSSTAARIARELGTIEGVTPVGSILVSLVGFATLLQLARLLVATRRPESVLLRSRGSSLARIVGAAAVDAAGSVVVGGALGATIGVVALVPVFGGEALRAPNPVIVATVVVASALTLVVTALIDARRLTRRDIIDDSGRIRGTATAAAAALSVIAAGFAAWQFQLYSSPIVTDATGERHVDPVAVTSPSLTIVAIALLALLAFTPIFTLLQRLASSRRGIQPYQSVVQVARRLGTYAVSILLVAGSVGAIVFGGYLAGTMASLEARSSQLANGADLRVRGATDDASGSQPRPSLFDSVPGVDGATAVSSQAIGIGDSTAQLVALPSAAIPGVLTTVDGLVDTRALARAVPAGGSGGVPLAAGAKSLSVTLTASTAPVIFGNLDGSIAPPRSGALGTVRGALWLEDSGGSLSRQVITPVDLDNGGQPATTRLTLPRAEGRWRIAAVDLSITSRGDVEYTIALGSITSGTTAASETAAAEPARSWGVQRRISPNLPTDDSAPRTPIGVSVFPLGNVDLRLMPALPGDEEGSFFASPPPLPVAVTRALARHLDLRVGDSFDFAPRDSSFGLPAKVGAITSVVPGTSAEYAVLADLPSLNDYFLRGTAIPLEPNELWLKTDAATAPLLRTVQRLAGPGSAVTVPTTPAAASASQVALTGLELSSVGTVMLALIAVSAVVITLTRQRAGESAALSSVGQSASAQAKARLGELLGVAALAAGFGVLAGLVAAGSTASLLARSVVGASDALPAPLLFSPDPALVVLAVEGVAIVLIGAVAAARVRAVAAARGVER
ncbi:hypothetical protein ACVXZ4_15805 [Lacisediminihabitans sp. FW035]